MTHYFHVQKRLGSSDGFLNNPAEPYKVISTVFDEAIDRAGIEDFHFHDLHYTFASRLVMAGVDLKIVQAFDRVKSHNNFRTPPPWGGGTKKLSY